MTRRLLRWEKISAVAGVCGVVALAVGYLIVQTTRAPLAGSDADYARGLLAERAKWEWVTLLRLIGGTLVVWFAALLGDRLQPPDGQPTRLAETVFGLGVVWAGVWLLSAFFNSASITLAADYGDPAGARIAGVLAAEIPMVLTAGVVLTMLLATWLASVRSPEFPRSYPYATGALAAVMLVLALIDWYGPGTLGWLIVALALTWMASTSVVLYRGA